MLLLKHIDNNLYIIDTEARIYNQCYFYDKVLNIVCATDEFTDLNYANQTDNVIRVIAQLKDQLSGVTLFDLPEKKVDLNKEIYLNGNYSIKRILEILEKYGYNCCLSDNKERKYTEQDMIKAIDNAFSAANFSTIRTFHQDLAKFKNDYFKAITTPNLQQYDGKQVEIEMENTLFENDKQNYVHGGKQQPKLTNGKITITKIV